MSTSPSTPAPDRWLPLVIVPALAALPALARLLAIGFVDQRYQTLMQSSSPSVVNWVAAALLLGAALWGARVALRRYGDGTPPGRSIFFAALPLLPLGFFWYFRMTYGGVLVSLFLVAVSVGRLVALVHFPSVLMTASAR